MKDTVRRDIPLTRKNLWILYCLLQFSKGDIEEITGWTRAKLDYGIRKWDLSMFSATWAETKTKVVRAMASKLGVAWNFDFESPVVGIADNVLERVREDVRSGRIDLDEPVAVLLPEDACAKTALAETTADVHVPEMVPVARSVRPNPFYFFRTSTRGDAMATWDVLIRSPENPERFEPGDEQDQRFSMRLAGTVAVKFNGYRVDSFITGHPNLTDAEGEQLAAQAEVVIREAALERDRLVDA